MKKIILLFPLMISGCASIIAGGIGGNTQVQKLDTKEHIVGNGGVISREEEGIVLYSSGNPIGLPSGKKCYPIAIISDSRGNGLLSGNADNAAIENGRKLGANVVSLVSSKITIDDMAIKEYEAKHSSSSNNVNINNTNNININGVQRVNSSCGEGQVLASGNCIQGQRAGLDTFSDSIQRKIAYSEKYKSEYVAFNCK